MPELPELQALAEGLTAALAGREVTAVRVHHPATLKTADPPVDALAGRRLVRVWRRGKLLGVEAEGAKITTIEGIADESHLHPIQQCFLEDAALQCGVCTPGFIMSAKALLDRKPSPSEHDIRFQLAGNLCRCTGYDKIVRAVQDSARALSAGGHHKGASGANGTPAKTHQTQTK